MPTSEEIDARAKLLAMEDGYSEEEWGGMDEVVRLYYRRYAVETIEAADS